MMITHEWRVGARPTRSAPLEAECHRRLRGPYTGIGTLLRRLVPDVQQRDRELVRGHAIEILSMAPELRPLIDAPPETLASVAAPEEQTRVYPALRTRRLSHGIVDFLAACGASEHTGPLELSFVNVDEADHTDQELLCLLVRRVRPDRVRVLVHSRTADLPEELKSALGTYATRVEGEARERAARGTATAVERGEARGQDALLLDYIASDGTSDSPAEEAAYLAADPARRAALHDARAAALQEQGEFTLRLGAIPYHLEHGSDPARIGGKALLEALEYCVSMGFHHAIVDYGMRGRAIVDPSTQMYVFWPLTGRTASALAAIGQPELSEPLYLEVRRRYSLPAIHVVNSYALAMLYTRRFAPEHRDYAKARTYLNTAIALATLWPEPVEQAFQIAFNNNGLALVEMREGNLEEALRLVTESLDVVTKAVPADTHRLHKSVLVYNKASLYARMGRLHEALAAYTEVLAADPNWQDYYFERADVRRRLGDPAGALADYDAAEPVTPPFWELHFNRGDLRAELGDLAGAVADLRRVVDLEPGEVDAWVNLLGLLLESGDVTGARRSVDDGLRFHPGHPRLLCIRGQVALEGGDSDQARWDFDLALQADADFADALACQAALAFDHGDTDSAIRDLTRAIETAAPDPDLYFNRAQALQTVGLWDAAISDYTRALELPGCDTAAILRQRGLCHGDSGDVARCRDDLNAASAARGSGERVAS